MTRILIVDEDSSVRSALKKFLSFRGFEAVAAESGVHGIRLVEAEGFDVAVIDIFTPGIDGLATIRECRRHAPSLPIIATSAFVFRDAPHRAPDFLAMATELGATRSLTKPFGPADLLGAIEACLGTDGTAPPAIRPGAAIPTSDVDAFYDAAPVGFALVSTELRFIRVNSMLADLNGMPCRDHVGRTLGEVIPAVAKLIEPVFREVIESGRPVMAFKLRGETAKVPGVQRTWLEDYFPLKRPDGTVAAVGAVVREIEESAQDRLAGGLTPAYLAETGQRCLSLARSDDRAIAAELEALGREMIAKSIAIADGS
jgi:CheY-like chemotaxis protein